MKRLLDAALPKNAGWPHVLGSALLWAILLQVATGILLAMYYSPTPDRAYASVKFIEEKMPAGSLVRGLHHWGATAVIVLAALHLARVFFARAYTGPRRGSWVVGWITFLAILGSGFTGYVLPGDINSYFSLQVGANVAGLIPGIGDAIVKFLLGGPQVEAWTLQRMFAFHAIVLPAVLALATLAHLILVARQGLVGLPSEKKVHPDLLPKIAVGIFLLTLVWVGVAAKVGAPLEPPADPTNTTYVPRPEWYFFGFQQLLRMFQGFGEFFAGIVAPGAIVVALIALPWYDRKPDSSGRIRVACGIVLLVGYASLTVAGYFSYRGDVANQPTTAAGVEPAAVETGWLDSGAPPEDLVDAGLLNYQAMNCATCHESPEAGRGVNAPAELASAGDRLRSRWVVEYLQGPHRIRWEDRGKRPTARMPDFFLTADEATSLAAYLSTQHDPTRVPATGIDWKKRGDGRGAVVYREMQCYQCHTIAGAGEEMGPELTKVAKRLKPDYMHAIINNPQKMIPGTKMKYEPLPPADVEALVRYLQSLK